MLVIRAGIEEAGILAPWPGFRRGKEFEFPAEPKSAAATEQPSTKDGDRAGVTNAAAVSCSLLLCDQ